MFSLSYKVKEKASEAVFFCASTALILSSSVTILAQGGRTAAKRYNIVFILLDDQRYDALGFLDTQPFMKTPNMDAIAKNGAYLPNAYVTTALCSPSRASILTGQYAHR